MLVNFLHFNHYLAFLGARVIHVGIEEATNLFVVVLETLQDEQLWYNEEYLSVTLLELLKELSVLFSCRLNYLREMQKLIERLAVEEVGETLGPAILEFDQNLDQLGVVLELWIDHFNVLVVLTQQSLEVVKGFLDSLSQISDGL